MKAVEPVILPAPSSQPTPAAATERDLGLTSRQLLDRARAGDATAIEDLAARYLPVLKRWAAGRLPPWARDLAETDDLVQDTLYKTLARLDVFEPQHDAALRPYLRRALHNRIRDEIGRLRIAHNRVDSAWDAAANVPSPLEQVLGSERVALYEAALERLPQDDRDAVIARLEMGASYREIALAYGKPSANAARMAVTRALLRLVVEITRADRSHA